MTSIKAQQASVCALGHLNCTFRCIELEHVCSENALIILVPYSSFPFPTYGRAPGFVYVLSLPSCLEEGPSSRQFGEQR